LKKQNKFVNGGRDGREEVGRRERESSAVPFKPLTIPNSQPPTTRSDLPQLRPKPLFEICLQLATSNIINTQPISTGVV
jgi:hypothetical protein